MTSFPLQTLAVIQQTTPEQKPLRFADVELQRVKNCAPKDSLVTVLNGSVNDVISQLPATSIAHFACHGQTESNPLESALILEDGPLTVSRFMQQRQSIPNLISDGIIGFPQCMRDCNG